MFDDRYIAFIYTHARTRIVSGHTLNLNGYCIHIFRLLCTFWLWFHLKIILVHIFCVFCILQHSRDITWTNGHLSTGKQRAHTILVQAHEGSSTHFPMQYNTNTYIHTVPKQNRRDVSEPIYCCAESAVRLYVYVRAYFVIGREEVYKLCVCVYVYVFAWRYELPVYDDRTRGLYVLYM